MAKKANKAGKRANGDGTIRQRKDGLWEARFTVGTDPGSGKPIPGSVSFVPSVAGLMMAAEAVRTLCGLKDRN